jgi:Domain of unknown function (DUF305)
VEQLQPHHDQAVEMSKMLMAKRSGVDPEVTALARQIAGASEKELDALNTWLAAWGPATADAPVTLSIARFQNVGGTTTAVGTVTDTVTGATSNVALPVLGGAAAGSGGSCQILDLVLGPLDLNLLGLVIHLDTVQLNITAQQGPGNLLGNLLCAVAGLLDGPTRALTNLPNQIHGALGQPDQVQLTAGP